MSSYLQLVVKKQTETEMRQDDQGSLAELRGPGINSPNVSCNNLIILPYNCHISDISAAPAPETYTDLYTFNSNIASLDANFTTIKYKSYNFNPLSTTLG